MAFGQLPVLAEAVAEVEVDADRLLSGVPVLTFVVGVALLAGVPEPEMLGVGSALLLGVGVGVTDGFGVGGFVGAVVDVGRGVGGFGEALVGFGDGVVGFGDALVAPGVGVGTWVTGEPGVVTAPTTRVEA